MTLTEYFNSLILNIKATDFTKAYIFNLFSDAVGGKITNKNSIIISYATIQTYIDAKSLGDWILWTQTFTPKSQKELASTIAKLSYYRCYKMMGGWQVYEELADNFSEVTSSLEENIKKNKDQNFFKQLTIKI